MVKLIIDTDPGEKVYRNKRDPIAKPFVFSTPTVAIGLTTALDGTRLDATYFHGDDGLGNVHKLAPQFTAPNKWIDLYSDKQQGDYIPQDLPFQASKRPSYELILNILREEEEDSVVIVAIGPLMNLAKAAEIDPKTFSRVKHIVSMGGALTVPGNVTPNAEFNIFSDAFAASNVFDLTSIQTENNSVVNKKIGFTLFPLDITNQHQLYENDYLDFLKNKNYLTPDGQLAADVPPLVEWVRVWLTTTFSTFKRIYGYDQLPENEHPPLGLNMHDPLALWYAINYLDDAEKTDSKWIIKRDQDVRVEVEGALTKGMTVCDLRGKPKRDVVDPDDHGIWLSTQYGNRINVAVSSPYVGSHFGKALLKGLFE